MVEPTTHVIVEKGIVSSDMFPSIFKVWAAEKGEIFEVNLAFEEWVWLERGTLLTTSWRKIK